MSLRSLADCRLYTFVDTAYLDGRDPSEIARQLGLVEIARLQPRLEPAQGLGARLGGVVEDAAEAEDGAQDAGRNADAVAEAALQGALLAR